MRTFPCAFCKKSFIVAYNGKRFCSIACSNRFNLNHKKNILLPEKNDANLAEFFGILLGDGSVNRYFTKIYLNRINDAEYAPFVAKLAKKLFSNARVSVTDTGITRGTVDVQISSVDVSKYLFKIGFDPKKRNIPKWITKEPKFAKATLRGLFDTEGTVGFKYFRGKNGNYFYKQLTVTNVNENVLSFVEGSLKRFGFGALKRSGKNIYISNKTDIQLYQKVIGSSNPKLTKKIKIQRIDEFTYGGGLRRMTRQKS
jgi:hypothetical protein